GNPCRRRAPLHGQHRHPRPARSSPATHWHEPRPDAPTLPSSSSTRSRCGRESSETRPRQHHPVRLPSMPLHVHIRCRGRKYWRRTEFVLTRWVKQLAGHSGRELGSFYPEPIAPESQAAKATASGCPAESVSLSLGPRTRLVLYRPPWRTQEQLRPRRPDSRERASEPLPLSAGLLRHCHKPLLADQHSPAILPQFPCCQPGWRSPQPAWSVRALWQDDRCKPRYRMRAPVQSSLRACPQTTVAVPPSLRSPPQEMQEH